MILTSAQLERLVAQARADAPNETCGLIGGKDGRALQIYPLKNVDQTPRIRYNPDQQDLIDAIRDVEWEHEWDVLAIYHSHPASPAYPSPTDVKESGLYKDSDVIFIIISLENSNLAQVRGFHIRSEGISKVTLHVE